MAGVDRYFLLIALFLFVYGVFVRFSTRRVQKHHKNFLGKSMSKPLAEKVVKTKNFFPFVFSHRPSICFYRVFGRFSA
jgi:hypothetical protein